MPLDSKISNLTLNDLERSTSKIIQPPGGKSSINFGTHQYNLPQSETKPNDTTNTGAGESANAQEKPKTEGQKTKKPTSPSTQQRKFAQQSARENKLRAQRSHITF
jgi:hypothetical protein